MHLIAHEQTPPWYTEAPVSVTEIELSRYLSMFSTLGLLVLLSIGPRAYMSPVKAE